MNTYELSKRFWDWSFENTHRIKPNHSALYFYIVDLSNRLGWKDSFGLPSYIAMEAIGIKNWKTYSNTLNDLVEFGFIKIIEKSKNQHSATIVAMVNFTKAHTKAHTKALYEHCSSTVVIDKPYNLITLELKKDAIAFDFKRQLQEIAPDASIVDFMKIRKGKKNTQLVIDRIIRESKKAGLTISEAINVCIEQNWQSFTAEYYDNIFFDLKTLNKRMLKMEFDNFNSIYPDMEFKTCITEFHQNKVKQGTKTDSYKNHIKHFYNWLKKIKNEN
jgi:hypothetical protein